MSATKIVDQMIMEKKSSHFFFLDLSLSDQNDWLKKNHSSLKPLKKHKVIYSADAEVSILEVNKFNKEGYPSDVLPMKEVSGEEQEQVLLQYVQEMLMNHAIQKYMYFENRVADTIPDYKGNGNLQFLEKHFNEFPKQDLEEDKEITTLEEFYDP